MITNKAAKALLTVEGSSINVIPDENFFRRDCDGFCPTKTFVSIDPKISIPLTSGILLYESFDCDGCCIFSKSLKFYDTKCYCDYGAIFYYVFYINDIKKINKRKKYDK